MAKQETKNDEWRTSPFSRCVGNLKCMTDTLLESLYNGQESLLPFAKRGKFEDLMDVLKDDFNIDNKGDRGAIADALIEKYSNSVSKRAVSKRAVHTVAQAAQQNHANSIQNEKRIDILDSRLRRMQRTVKRERKSRQESFNDFLTFFRKANIFFYLISFGFFAGVIISIIDSIVEKKSDYVAVLVGGILFLSVIISLFVYFKPNALQDGLGYCFKIEMKDGDISILNRMKNGFVNLILAICNQVVQFGNFRKNEKKSFGIALYIYVACLAFVSIELIILLRNICKEYKCTKVVTDTNESDSNEASAAGTTVAPGDQGTPPQAYSDDEKEGSDTGSGSRKTNSDEKNGTTANYSDHSVTDISKQASDISASYVLQLKEPKKDEIRQKLQRVIIETNETE